jgi:hypothetical protein
VISRRRSIVRSPIRGELSNAAFDAFVSYSHAADDALAPAVRRGLEHLSKPWYRRRALSVYLYKTGLGVTPELWSTIVRALDASGYLVLLASPGVAASRWVNQEVEHWLAHRGPETILPVVTAGAWVWDPAANDLDHTGSTAAPPALYGHSPKNLLTWTCDGPPPQNTWTCVTASFAMGLLNWQRPFTASPRANSTGKTSGNTVAHAG